jgi:hypothetical protein
MNICTLHFLSGPEAGEWEHFSQLWLLEWKIAQWRNQSGRFRFYLEWH